MYEKFKFERIALSLIRLDDRNPRIVTPNRLATEDDIVSYLFDNEDLASFLETIAVEGRNPGSERPYVIRDGKEYVVIEGNTRIAVYKLLTGQLTADPTHSGSVPLVSQAVKDELVSVEVTIAPSRDSLMTIMARAHFGRGDKNRWSYLGSRRAVYDDWKAGKSVANLSNVFGRPKAQIRDLLLEYLLYLEVLELGWTANELEVLQKPSLEFNPPVRFLQSTGHKQLVGIELDRVNLEIKLIDAEAKHKLKHLVKRMVVEDGGPSATASYSDVFGDYVSPGAAPGSGNSGSGSGGTSGATGGGSGQGGQNGGTGGQSGNAGGSGNSPTLKPGALFAYPVTRNDLTLAQLMKEAKAINAKNFPAAGASLLRSIVEVLLKVIVDQKKLNQNNKSLDIEGALNLVVGNGKMSLDDVRVLQDFKKNHLAYLNLSAHATVVPNYDRLKSALDTIDPFVKRNI